MSTDTIDFGILPGYTRVTDILKGFSKYDSIPEDILNTASDRGTRTHKFCEMHVNKLFYVVDEDCSNYVECFKNWLETNVSDVISTEKRFYNDEYKLTGCVDMIVKMKDDDCLAIVDIKTTSKPYVSWSLQTAAYAMISGYGSSVRRVAVNLPKTGNKVKQVEYYDYENDIRLYMNALELYRLLVQKN